MSRIRWQGSTGQFLILQDTTRYAVRLELTYCQLCSIEGKREETCASHYHGRKNFWFSTIFLDSDGHLHCRTMDEKYGLPFVPKCKRAEESHTCPFVLFFFCHICRKTRRSRILLPWQRYIVFPLHWRICRVGYSTLYIYSALFFLLSLVKQTQAVKLHNNFNQWIHFLLFSQPMEKQDIYWPGNK